MRLRCGDLEKRQSNIHRLPVQGGIRYQRCTFFGSGGAGHGLIAVIFLRSTLKKILPFLRGSA
jgi:hypothetical protein